MTKKKSYVALLLLSALVSYSCSNTGKRLPSSAQTNSSKVKRAMGLNMSAPQSEQKKVSAPILSGNLFQMSRPFVESIYKRIRQRIKTQGPMKSVGLPLDAQDKDVKLELSDFYADKYAYRYAQKNKVDFPEFGVKVHPDKTVTLTRKGAMVYTSLLESARQGDVPDGIYPLYVTKDVSVKVEGFGKIVSCNNQVDYATQISTPARNIAAISTADKASLKEVGIDIERNCVYRKVFKKKLGFWRNLWGKIKDWFRSLFGQNFPEKINNMPDCEVIDKQEALNPSGTSTGTGAGAGAGANSSDADITAQRNNDGTTSRRYANRVCIDIKIPKKPDTEGLKISFTALKKVHLKDIKMIMPGVNGRAILDGETVFNPAYIDYIKDFKVLRVMNLINASPRSPQECVYTYDKKRYGTWNNVDRKTPYGECLMKFSRTLDNRAKLNDITWGNSYLTPLEDWRGVPYEVLVDLAKETGADLWVNIPHNATPEYIKAMADYFVSELPESQKVTLEYSNEIWNGGFWGQKYMIGLANDRKKYYEEQAVEQVQRYVNKRTRFKESYQAAFEANKDLKLPQLEAEMASLDSYWNGYINARRELDNAKKGIANVERARLSYNPDLISQLDSEEIKAYEAALQKDYDRGYRVGKSDGLEVFDDKMEARVHVKKRLLRAYQYIASLSYVDQVAKIHDIWIDAGFPKSRLITVLGTKQSNPSLTEIMLEYADTKNYIDKIDGIATAAYFYGCLGHIDGITAGEIGECSRFYKGIMSVKNSSELLDILEAKDNPKGVAAVEQQFKDHLEVIKGINKKIKLLSYEGGHHLTTSLAKRKQIIYMNETPGREEQLLSIFREAIEDPRMGDLTEELYKSWMRTGGSTFINFDMAHGYHKWGAFGLSESVSDKDTPRYQSAHKYIEIFE